MTGGEDAKPNVDSKPNTAAQNRRKKALPPPPPEGRIGTMVVMKSGRVKMVMGEDIVMNVSLTYIQMEWRLTLGR
jgi:DNA-directed RNA polymerase III subunit RPC4